MSSLTEVETEIVAYIRGLGGRFGDWYAGIAASPRHRLFQDHNVSQATGAWIYRDAGSEAGARALERHLLSLGCKGDEGGGDPSTRYAYAYKITPYTSP
jgi:hypothetical protein